jgi:hypothetical protein
VSAWLLVFLMPVAAGFVFVVWYLVGVAWEFWAARRESQE